MKSTSGTITHKQLIGQLNWRYATKQFDPKRKISPSDWAVLEEALMLTPSSFGLQPWKFVVVTDQAIREKLVAVSWEQRQVADASHLVVFAIKKNFGEREIDDYLSRVVEIRGGTMESLLGYRERVLGSLIKGRSDAARKTWESNQVYIALGNFLTSAALLGIDACPLEGIDPVQYDKILGLDQHGLGAMVAAAAGYRAEGDKYASLKKVRFPKEQLFLRI